MRLREWLRRRRLERDARRRLDDLFRSPERLRGTSLAPRHLARCVILGFDEENGEILRVRFGLVRHPRPYPFSRQSHQVVEYYLYDLRTAEVRVEHGINLTRRAGEDACE
jgi:hypothetical protein